MNIQAKSFDNGARSAETTVVELNRVVAQAEELLKTLGEESGVAAESVRQRVVRTVNQAKLKIAEAGSRVRETTTGAARATDRYVQENPWKAIGYGAVAGAAVALIVSAILRRE